MLPGKGVLEQAITAMAVVVAVTGEVALAAPPAEAPRATPAEATGAPAGGADAARARAHFEQGVALLGASDWAAALGEFLLSRRLYPTPKATNNAAVCLRELGRFDEALEMVESLLAEFPALSPEMRIAAESEAERLRDLVGAVAIEGAEPGATLLVDGRRRGELPLRAPLRLNAGSHRLRVVKEGLEPFEATVEVEPRRTARLDLRPRAIASARGGDGSGIERNAGAPAQERDPRAPERSARPRFTIELAGAALVAPTFGGAVAGECGEGCSRSPGLGGYAAVRGGVRLAPWLGVGLALGYLAAHQTVSGRATTIRPVGLAPRPGTADDTLKLRGALAGAWAGVTLGERPSLHLRLGAGALAGSIGDRRTGTFSSRAGSSYRVGPVGDAPSATFVCLAPEIRIGMPAGEHVQLTAGIEGLLLVGLSRPRWRATRLIDAAEDGAATFAGDDLAGRVLLGLAPGVGASYAF
ncbi:PEGA domain-containing protein [Sorangium sp. So ce341]|uniref:PEGA domain-containing protein n=1 Tax=Sorangium sp. So ce341 TaxID=3133302 RepID=UPI003F606446